MKTLLLVAVALIAGSAAADVVAAPAANAPPSVIVRYADLNLSEPGQAAVMLKRIRRAAATACYASPWNSGTGIDAIERFDACFQTAMRTAVVRLDAPQVTARFEDRSSGGRLARVP